MTIKRTRTGQTRKAENRDLWHDRALMLSEIERLRGMIAWYQEGKRKQTRRTLYALGAAVVLGVAWIVTEMVS